MKYTELFIFCKIIFALWYLQKSDGGCFAGWSLLRCSRKTKGVGGNFENAVSNVQNSVYM
jgi:hypothetical protein